MNETIDKVKETDDMVLLIEQHKKDIWEYKQNAYSMFSCLRAYFCT